MRFGSIFPNDTRVAKHKGLTGQLFFCFSNQRIHDITVAIKKTGQRSSMCGAWDSVFLFSKSLREKGDG